MNTHRYLRAYMAGIVVPTVVLAIIITAFFIARYVSNVQIPIERAIIFPMALVPSLFGLWNMLYTRLHTHRYLSLGLHGALLPLILMPLGATGAVALGFLSIADRGVIWFQAITIPYALLAPWFGVALVAYYLVWKHLIGFFNRVLEIA